MTTSATARSAHLLRRKCVACGYDGGLLRGGTIPRCPRCSCDLHERPALSYAEMEGLLAEPSKVVGFEPPNEHRRLREQLIHRWIGFLFLVLTTFVVVIYLAAEAFNL